MVIAKNADDQTCSEHEDTRNTLATGAKPGRDNAAKNDGNIEIGAEAKHEAGRDEEEATDDESATGSLLAHWTWSRRRERN